MATDTGATANYLIINVPEDSTELEHKPSKVILPNGQTIKSCKIYLLPSPTSIPREARIANSFKHLTEGVLLSIGQLCDNGCIAVFYSNKVDIYHNNTIILTRERNYSNSLWYIDIANQEPHTKAPNIPNFHLQKIHKMNYIVPKTNAEKLVRFIHTTCGSPSINSFAYAIKKGYLATWPNLSIKNMKQYLRVPTATILRHLNHQQKNKLSTKKIYQSEMEQFLDYQPPKQVKRQRSNLFYITTYEDSNRIYTNKTGCFPI